MLVCSVVQPGVDVDMWSCSCPGLDVILVCIVIIAIRRRYFYTILSVFLFVCRCWCYCSQLFICDVLAKQSASGNNTLAQYFTRLIRTIQGCSTTHRTWKNMTRSLKIWSPTRRWRNTCGLRLSSWHICPNAYHCEPAFFRHLFAFALGQCGLLLALSSYNFSS